MANHPEHGRLIEIASRGIPALVVNYLNSLWIWQYRAIKLHRVRGMYSADSGIFERQAQSDDLEVSASDQLVVIFNDKAQRLAAWERLHGCE